MGLMIAETEGLRRLVMTRRASHPCPELLIIIPALSSLAVPGPSPMMLSGQRQLSRQWHHLLGTRRLLGHSYYYVNRFPALKKHKG